MNLRERYKAHMHFQKVDRVPNFEFGYWPETLPTWHEQGLPSEINEEKRAYKYFGIEDWVRVPVDAGLCPFFEEKIIKETEEHIIYLDGEKVTAEKSKKSAKTIPHYIDFPIKSRQDWLEFLPRLNPDTPERFPSNWQELVKTYKNRDYPLSIHFGSMIGTPRNWIGFENLAYMVYDNPALVEEMVETMCNLSFKVSEKALRDVEFDFAEGWEDICYNSGPIISPKMFHELVTPRYKRLSALFHKYGTDIMFTDCDGNIFPIIPEFLEGGINCMFPIEVRAGSDPVEMRKRFPKILLQGGVDKTILLKGPDAIEKEMKRLKPLVDEGGYIPHIDHRAPMDAPFENYKYYMKMKREILGCGAIKPEYKE